MRDSKLTTNALHFITNLLFVSKVQARYTNSAKNMVQRCSWTNNNNVLIRYHDEEWGVQVTDDIKHFEMLSLEGAQAGLNWLTVLQKRENYRRLFKEFDPNEVVKMDDEELEMCLQDSGIIRNKLKVYSVRKNAKSFLKIQNEFGSFHKYIWDFVGNNQIVTNDNDTTKVLCTSLSNDLKRRGMSFVGPTIIEAYLQAVGVFNAHSEDCHRYRVCLIPATQPTPFATTEIMKSNEELAGETITKIETKLRKRMISVDDSSTTNLSKVKRRTNK